MLHSVERYLSGLKHGKVRISVTPEAQKLSIVGSRFRSFASLFFCLCKA